MPDERKTITKLTLADGSRVGIVNLDSILKEVAGLKLTNSSDIKAELINKTEAGNYIPSGAKADYTEALFLEYQRKYGGLAKVNKPETHKHTAG